MRLGGNPKLELEELLALGHESRSLEVKAPGDPGNLNDKRYVAKTARAVMAMGNLRNGGIVCLGIDETTMRDLRPGLSQAQIEAWTNFDEVQKALSVFADPPVTFELRSLRLSSGARVVVLEVDEFETVPHVCVRDSADVLHAADVYVRPRGMPRSVRVPDSREMRELLDSAIDKGLRDFLRRTRAAGVSVGNEPPPEDSGRAEFDVELAKAWPTSSPVLARLQELGHTDIAIRPGPYDAERIGPASLERLLQEQTVRMRGWPLPYIDPKKSVDHYGTSIGQDIEPTIVPHLEAWRLFTSGQFLHRRALSTDMRDSPRLEPIDDRATGAVALWDIVLYMVEVAELAARLTRALACDQISFTVDLAGVDGRQLIAGDAGESLRAGLIVHRARLTTDLEIPTDALLADVRGAGIALAQGLVTQFGLDLPDSALNDLQQRIFGR